jgi:excisionase family DNA binding protein
VGGGGRLFVKLEPEAGMETYLTVKEVALLLKLSVQTSRRYTMNKEIPFHQNNRAVRYKKSEIELWFEKRGAARGKVTAENLEVIGEMASGEAGGEV